MLVSAQSQVGLPRVSSAKARSRLIGEGWMTTHGGRGPKEREVQSAITDWLTHKHYFWWRNNTGSFLGEYKGKKRFVRFGKKGSPDIFVLIKGRLIGIEVKGDGGFQSQVQKEFEVEFTRAGGVYLLCFSLEDAMQGIAGVSHG
jgi:hypothetical protein